MYKYEDIRQVHLEITQRCQAACPMCDRNENGGPDNRHITNAELSLEDCQNIFEPAFIRQLTTMYMCGNLGDPIVARDTLEVFEYFRKHNPDMWLSMNTNAGAKDEQWWRDIARTYGRMGAVIFSVDGLSDTNHLYRQNVQWDKVERNMRTFIEADGRARWDFIVFGHNEHQVDEARALAEKWGVERFQLKKSGRFFSATGKQKTEHQAKNRKGEDTQLLQNPAKEENQNRAVQKQPEVAKKHGSMDNYFDNCGIKCKVKEWNEIFISAEGLLLPCCWTAGRMYKWWHPDYRAEQIWDFIDAAGGTKGISVIDNSIQDVMAGRLLSDIENSWDITGVANGKLKVCSMKCGTELDPFGEQFK